MIGVNFTLTPVWECGPCPRIGVRGRLCAGMTVGWRGVVGGPQCIHDWICVLRQGGFETICSN